MKSISGLWPILLLPMAFAIRGAPPPGVSEKDALERTFIDARDGFSHAVVVRTGNVKTIYTSGQVGRGNDLREQTRSSFESLRSRLEAAGASFDDIVKINTYIVGYEPRDLDIFKKVRAEMLGTDRKMPAHTLVGVETLAVPGDLIEIEAVAIVANGQ